MDKMNIKIHRTKCSLIVAFCDKELIGKELKEGDLCIKITERFYKGEDLPENRIIEILKDANSINVVGEKSIQIALKAGIIKEDNIKRIKDIPFAISI